MSFAVRGQVTGLVQGVGFRMFVKQQALLNGLKGSAINLADGSVEVVLCGERKNVEQVQTVLSRGPSGSRVERLAWQTLADNEQAGLEGFRIG